MIVVIIMINLIMIINDPHQPLFSNWAQPFPGRSEHQHHLLRQLNKLWTCEFFSPFLLIFYFGGEVMTKKTALVKRGKLLILTNRRPHLSQSLTLFCNPRQFCINFGFGFFWSTLSFCRSLFLQMPEETVYCVDESVNDETELIAWWYFWTWQLWLM